MAKKSSQNGQEEDDVLESKSNFSIADIFPGLDDLQTINGFQTGLLEIQSLHSTIDLSIITKGLPCGRFWMNFRKTSEGG